MITETIVYDGAEGQRIDVFLSGSAGKSRSYIQKLITEKLVYVDSKPVKANYRLTAGDTVSYSLPETCEPDIAAEDIPLDIVYEDNDIIIINKPKGMVVHPAAGNYSGTLVNALMQHCRGSLSGINGVMRPGIVHRIDKDTTGILAVCKNDNAHRSLAEQLKAHSINRKYEAIVYNAFDETDGTVSAPIGRHPVERKRMAVNYKNGRDAVTHYHVIENLGSCSYIECRLETGRTHQIRVHMASISHPLLGDKVYGPGRDRFGLQGQALHASLLGFIHPATGKYVEFSAPLPQYFQELLQKLRSR